MAQSDEALRRLVVRLSGESVDDIDAVLDGLTASERTSVLELLAAYKGEPSAATLSPIGEARASPVTNFTGLSPWLAVRLEKSAGPSLGVRPSRLDGGKRGRPFDDGGGFEMTPHALQALQAAAQSLQGRGGANMRAVARPSDTAWGRARAAIEGLWR